MRAIPVFLSALALALPAVAQDTDLPGCIEGNPCEVTIDVDAQGMDVSETEFTAGDWVMLSVYNDDEVPHTITLSGHDVTLVVPSYDIEDSEPFELPREGTYALRDSPSGDEAQWRVLAPETFPEPATGGDGEGNGTPGPAPALLLGALAAAAAVLRRRA